MAKTVSLTSSDLEVKKTKSPSGSTGQRGTIPSADLVPLQFRMPADFVKEFKQEALNQDMKLNELFAACFRAYSGK